VRGRRVPAGAGRAAAGVLLSAAVLLALGGCSLSNPAMRNAASAGPTDPHRPPASPSTYSPLAGPVEAAARLPAECSQILSTAQLQAVFGAGMPIGDDYSSYAPLPGIGRTGRVACVFGIGLDSFGRQSTGALEVSIATYTGAAEAVGRAADTVRSDSQAGATTAAVSVGGHPATVVVEQTPVGASTATSPSSASATPSPATTATTPGSTAAAPTAVGTPSATGSPAASGGETELVMADGNRTFVLQSPFTRLPAQQAITALTGLALETYQNTSSVADFSAPGAPPGPSGA
jgi:hypothetical protein